MTMLEMIERFLLKNRTIVTQDFKECLALIAQEIPLEIHAYPTGKEFATWPIPPQWEVKKALISDGENVIASYEDHPLFLAPYSHSFTGWVSREDLIAHVLTSEKTPDTFCYEYRLAYDYRRRLKEWCISLPYTIVQNLNQPQYFVDIQVETSAGHMLVGESRIKGQYDYTFSFLSHLCHSGQANDGLAGVAVGVEVMKRLRKLYKNPKYNYQLLITPETIGSAVYLSQCEEQIDSYLGCVFTEMPGVRVPLVFGHSRRGNTYFDRIMKAALINLDVDFSECGHMEVLGNDERVFDSAGVGVPGLALERIPFDGYHTSRDNLSETHQDALEEVVEVLVELVRILESDFIPAPQQRVPVYLTRYNLYADWENAKDNFDLNASIIENLWSGKSVFDIAHLLGISFYDVRHYILKFVEHGLVKESPLTPQYVRRNE